MWIINGVEKKKCWDSVNDVRYINSNVGGYSRGCLGYSVHGVRVSDRWGGRERRGRGWRGRRADVPREVPGVAVEVHRHVLRVGLRMAVAEVPARARVHSVRPVRRALHHPVHRRQHVVHGARSSRDEPQVGFRAQQSQRCEYLISYYNDVPKLKYDVSGNGVTIRGPAPDTRR